MKEYLIYKNLIQFSNLVDAQGNPLPGVSLSCTANDNQAQNGHDDYGNDDEAKEGGEAETLYEGGS